MPSGSLSFSASCDVARSTSLSKFVVQMSCTLCNAIRPPRQTCPYEGFDSPIRFSTNASDVRVIVVKDHEFGTNDCRGWISRSLFGALQERSRAASGRDLPGDRLYQFRLAFDSTQAKGACKVME